MNHATYGVRVKVPASTANLGPGFDSLGLALGLYTWVEMRPADKTVIRLYGRELEGKDIPLNKNNLVYQVAQQVFARAGAECPELDISMYSDIPLARGLGSSASAIVAGLVAANALLGKPLSDEELFTIASSLEHHPDNVGASLFGGFVAAFWDGVRAKHIRIEPDERLEAFVAIPRYELSTSKARDVLPREVPMNDAVFNVSHSNLLVAALCTGRLDLLGCAMRDRLHQPYRSNLVPGMDEVLQRAVDHGALGIALSGAGPTMIALVNRHEKGWKQLEPFMRDVFRKHGVEVDTLVLPPDRQGAVVELLTPAERSSTLIENIKGETRA